MLVMNKGSLPLNVLFLICSLLLLFCKPNTPVDNNDSLIVGIASDPTTLDPIYSVDLISQKINSLLFTKLFRYNKDGGIEGELAKEFTFIGNELHIKIHKVETVDKSYLTSTDIIYSLNRLRREKGPRKSKYGFIKEIQRISDFDLEMELDSTNKKNIGLLALSPASIYQELAHKNNGVFKSSGLYSLDKWNKNETLQLSLNQIKGNQLANQNLPDKLVLQVLNQPSSAIYLFQKGKLDVMKIPYFLLDHPAVKENEKKIVKGKSIQYIAINHNNLCFDLPFRKALNYAINRRLIIGKIFESAASEINASVTDEYLYPYTKERFYYTYNLDLAKKYLSESKCYPKILSQPLELRMRADDENKSKGYVLAQYLKDLGLNIIILPMEKTKLYKENGEKKGDLTLLTWYIDYDSIHNFIDPLFASDSFGNSGNRSFYSNPLVDEYIRKIRSNPDSNYNTVEIVKVLNEDAPWVFLWSIHENYILSKKASNFTELIELLVM